MTHNHTINRTDVHRPSAIVPSEYRLISYDYIGPDPFSGGLLRAERARLREHMANTGGKFSNHEHGGTCHVCGATAFYIANFFHAKSNSYIVTGEDCAAKMGLGDPAAFRTFRDKVRVGIEAAAGKRKAEAVLKNAGLERAWAIYDAEDRTSAYEENTIVDIVGKLVRYGSVSDKQLDFVRRLLTKIDDRAVVAARRAAEDAAALPVPVTSDRIEISGTVISLKVVDGFGYGQSVTKMLVKTDAGWKVYGTRPGSLAGIDRGAKVVFTARVERSKDDDRFGWFSRPTNARVLDDKIEEVKLGK